ncbi:MAG: MFS transporter [Nocardioides sp.]
MTAAATQQRDGGQRLLSRQYAATTVGMFALCAFVAFEATAVTTIMPTVAADLHGFGLFALAFAAPLASGVVGMVAAGGWSDARGPVRPLVGAILLFAVGLVGCGLAPTMQVLVGARVVQGLGGGALTVCLYVMVGLLYPPALRPAIFSSFAAAWVLPTTFGPAVAAYVAHVAGWRWVFLGVVVLVAVAATLIWSALRGLAPSGTGVPAPRSRLAWAVLSAAAVLSLQLLGSGRAILLVLPVAAAAVALTAMRPLVPRGTLRARPGLPAVIATRALLSGAFLCGETYVIYVLERRWGLSAGVAGLSLTGVGLSWAGASWAQSRLSRRLSDTGAMRIGAVLVLGGHGRPHHVGPAPSVRSRGGGGVHRVRRGDGPGLPAHQRLHARVVGRLRSRVQLRRPVDRRLAGRGDHDRGVRRPVRHGEARGRGSVHRRARAGVLRRRARRPHRDADRPSYLKSVSTRRAHRVDHAMTITRRGSPVNKKVMLAAGATLLLTGAGTGYAVAASAGGTPGQGTLSEGYSVPGPFSGADASTAGTGVIKAGSQKARITVRLPAFTIPNAGGGQDENHAIVTVEGTTTGVWVTSARVTPSVSGYDRSTGTLVVRLNKKAPADVTVAYWTFGVFQD